MSPIMGLAYGGMASISSCKVVFCGDFDRCDNITPHLLPEFAVADWPAVAAYVSAGGRLWVQGEWASSARHGILPVCTSAANVTRVNNFLAAIGSTMTFVAEDLLTGDFLTPGPANIAAGMTSVFSDFASEVNAGSGTVVFTGGGAAESLGKTIIAVEKIGSGFVFLSADSNIGENSGGPSPTFCTFVKRLWEYTDAQII